MKLSDSGDISHDKTQHVHDNVYKYVKKKKIMWVFISLI